jgi:hypothetical protein
MAIPLPSASCRSGTLGVGAVLVVTADAVLAVVVGGLAADRPGLCAQAAAPSDSTATTTTAPGWPGLPILT